MPDPGGRDRDLGERAFAETQVELRQRRLERGIGAHATTRQRPSELAVVVAEQEDAAAFVDQAERHAKRLGAVRTVISEVAELHDETIGFDRGGKRAGVAVDVADDPERDIGGDRIGDPVADAAHGPGVRPSARKASSARARPSSRSTTGRG